MVWGGILLTTIWVAVQFTRLERSRSEIRQDLATVQDVQLGLFNVDEWQDALATAFVEEVHQFELNTAQIDTIKPKIEELMHDLIRDLERNYRKENSKDILGKVKIASSEALGIFEEMHRSVPDFADRVVSFIDDPEQKELLREYVLKTLDKGVEQTFSETDYSNVDGVLDKWNIPEGSRRSRMATGVDHMETTLAARSQEMRWIVWSSLLLFLLTVVALFVFVQGHFDFKLAVMTTAIWLVVGVSMPLLLIDARIDSFDFQFIGHPVTFKNQVLFYQSKSISDVVQLLMLHGQDVATKFAGFGVLLFSVVLPMAKLMSIFAWRHGASWTHSRAGKFLLFQSSKWAMADVMVVAIFLSHLGFNGVMDDQIGRFEDTQGPFSILSTGMSSMLPGFFAFFGFALISMFLSARLNTLSQKDEVSCGDADRKR